MRRILALFFGILPAVNIAFSFLEINAFDNGNFNSVMATRYYFSSNNGNDNNTGLSAASPWQSLNKLRQITGSLKAGDMVCFEKGSSWDNAYFELQDLNATQSNPIVFTTYGTGSRPSFRGSKKLTSFMQKGNLWNIVDKDFPDYNESVFLRVIPFVYINGKKEECSRYPNSGYLNTITTGTNNYLEDATQSWVNDQWKYGLAVVKNVNWRWCTRRINSNTASRLNFEEMDRNFERENTPYLIRNHVLACDQNGEWAQQNDTLWIYSVSNLNDQLVEVPVVDTIIKVINCSHIEFSGLQVERANVYDLYFNNSISKISDCNVNDAGGMLIYADNQCNIYTGYCSFSGGRRGGVFYEFSHGEVSNNTFRNMAFDGIDNTEHTYGPCISSWRCDGNFYSRFNRMDSVNLGYNMHWSKDSVWIEDNFITNFGMTLNDVAAIYFGADFTGPDQGSYKYVRKNIMLNAHGRFVHGIYLDSNSNFIECDSNTMAHTNLAVFIHVSKNNIIRHSNIIDPAFGMDIYAWNQAIRLDEYSYQYGGEGSPIINNVVTDNNVVLGQTLDETAFATLNVSDLGSNTIDRNKYFDPYTSDQDVFLISKDYTTYNYQTLNTWQANTGKDLNSTYNPFNLVYSSASGIDADDFVLLLCNPSEKDSVFDLRPYGARFLDVNGNLVSNSVTVPSCYSKILFFKEKSDAVNQQPLVENSSFDYFIGETDDLNIGKIQASDPDGFQKLTYSITGGDPDGLIGINPEIGMLYLANKSIAIEGDKKLKLSFEVSDNGFPSMKAAGQAEIQLFAWNSPPIINNQNFTLNEGSGNTTLVGKIIANDPDAGQVLNYEIISGNEDNHFRLDKKSGELFLVSESIDFLENSASVLNIRAEDNGPIAKNSTAYITVSFVPATNSNVYYIDPGNSNDLLEDGSLQHPFDAWSDVVWKDGYSYLQKRGTVASSNKINIFASNVTLGAYGEGERPVIISQTKDFVIRAYEESNVAIFNLQIIAKDAISCIYFMGETSNNNLVENCRFEGSENGVRIIAGKSYIIKCNTFNNRSDAIYSYAENTEVYYNVFKSNATAINITSYLSVAKIFNNIFYDNNQGILTTYADLVIYNNIFYLTRSSDVAINDHSNKMISDHNIFYPEQPGFITVASKAFKSLLDYQQDKGLDLHSFAEDPMFRDIYKEDFELQSGSPGIDAGINVGLAYDFYGTSVPSGGAPDIGMIESKGVTGSDTSIFKFGTKGIENKLSVYPNPSDGRFTLSVDTPDIGNATIEVKDMSGRLIYSQTHCSFPSASIPIDISNKPRGIYIVIMQLKDRFLTERAVIN
jgi:Secretion system C-terminal sorting domain/Cadherin domain/Right handed beta helix region